MQPLGVVDRQPVLSDLPDLRQRREDPGIEHFVPLGAIEALDEGVLIGLAGRDRLQPDPLGLAPARQGLGDQLWSGGMETPEGSEPAITLAAFARRSRS